MHPPTITLLLVCGLLAGVAVADRNEGDPVWSALFDQSKYKKEAGLDTTAKGTTMAKFLKQDFDEMKSLKDDPIIVVTNSLQKTDMDNDEDMENWMIVNNKKEAEGIISWETGDSGHFVGGYCDAIDGDEAGELEVQVVDTDNFNDLKGFENDRSIGGNWIQKNKELLNKVNGLEGNADKGGFDADALAEVTFTKVLSDPEDAVTFVIVFNLREDPGENDDEKKGSILDFFFLVLRKDQAKNSQLKAGSTVTAIFYKGGEPDANKFGDIKEIGFEEPEKKNTEKPKPKPVKGDENVETKVDGNNDKVNIKDAKAPRTTYLYTKAFGKAKN